MIDLINKIKDILNAIIPVLGALGLVYFVWGVVQYVINDSEEAKKKGKDRIIYGIIGFTVIVGLWGLVNIVVKTFFKPSDLVAPSLSPLTGPASCTTLADNPKFQDVLCYITSIINNAIIPLIFALAVAAFVWGVVQFFFLNADDVEKKSKGKQFMIWGIIALTVMVSVWGLVKIVGNTFGIDSTFIPQVVQP